MVWALLALALGPTESAQAQDGPNQLTIGGAVITYPGQWTARRYPTVSMLWKLPAGAKALPSDPALQPALPHITVSTEIRRDHEEAVRRLRSLSGGKQAPADILAIGGWPAIQVSYLTARAQPGRGDSIGKEKVLVMRTAVAAGRTLVRLEALLPPDAPAELITEVRGIGLGLVFDAAGDPAQVERDIKRLKRSLRSPALAPAPTAPRRRAAAPPSTAKPGATRRGEIPRSAVMAALPASAGATVSVSAEASADSELEIAVSGNGRDMVVGSNGNWYFSSDAGQTWSPTGVNGNDPSVAWGQSGGPLGTFYAANITIPPATTPPAPPAKGFTRMQVSTDGGASWSAAPPAYTCAQNGDIDCSTAIGGVNFPDQEHIAVDRWNLTAGGDQVYSAWRHRLASGWGIVCSTDSGNTWSANAFVAGAGDLPRITVGADGFVYVVYLDSGNIMLSKFQSCETQTDPMTPELFFPVVVRENVVDVACPMPGLNRCNNGNRLLSPVVAVDDTDAGHIYVAYANNTNPGDGTPCANQNLCNEDVIVQDSLNGGLTWRASDPTDFCLAGVCLNSGNFCAANADCFDPARTVAISSGVTARRFMPWVCAVGGTAYVSWYDRRAAFPGGTAVSNNSLTDYFAASAFLDPLGAMTAGPEFQVNAPGTADPQCEGGFPTGSAGSWPNGTRATADSDSCSVQPQLAGLCCAAADVSGGLCSQANSPTVSSLQRCDFDQGPACPGVEVCSRASGFPKYGDYNGNACGQGRLYMTWASAIAPPALPAATDIDSFFSSKIVCCVPQIQVPGPIAFGIACGTGPHTTTLNVCNSGKEDLEVASIASSDPQFAVTPPLSGYPVTISPDFCFPFQATFTPDESGNTSATLTIATNDPVNPSLSVGVSGTAGEAAIVTFIADDGNFGDVCSDDLRDLNLTVQSNGACPLVIDGVSLVGGDAADFELPSGGFAGTVVEPGNSLLIPVRFAPTNFTDPSPRTTTVRVESHTQDGADLADDDTPIAGTVPPPDINLAIANSGAFGAVCSGEHADLDLTLFNQGKCDLTISSITIEPAGSFELPADLTFPLILSHDADFTVPVRYAPDDCSDDPENAVIVIASDDPDENPVNVDISGTAPCPDLAIDPEDLTGLFAFPATVVDGTGTLGCFSDRTVTLRNRGACPLTIDDISAAAADFTVIAPTEFPVILPSGEETLVVTVRFTPQADDNPLAPSEVTGTLTVVSDDPDTPGVADLCGESVAQSGVRILVAEVSSGAPVPVDGVDTITLQSKGKSQPGPINLSYSDQPVSAANVCGNPISYHVDQETLPSTATTGSNPKSSYEAKAREGNLQATESFILGQCEFRQFQLQLRDASSDTCLLLPKGAACTTDGECCSGKCKGGAGAKTCR